MAIGKIVLDDEGWKDMSEIPPTKHQMLGGIAKDVGLSEVETKAEFKKKLKQFSKKAEKALAPKEHNFLKRHLEWLASLSWGAIKFILEDLYEFIIIPVGEYTYDSFILSPEKWVKKFGKPKLPARMRKAVLRQKRMRV